MFVPTNSNVMKSANAIAPYSVHRCVYIVFVGYMSKFDRCALVAIVICVCTK